MVVTKPSLAGALTLGQDTGQAPAAGATALTLGGNGGQVAGGVRQQTTHRAQLGV